MYNMCKLSPTRQEAAALAGIVPLLVKLASPSPHDAQPPPPSPLQAPVQSSTQTAGADSATSSASGDDVATVSGRGSYPLRPLAVSLLCGMAHSTHRARHELWAHNVVALLLDLLKEEVSCFSLMYAVMFGRRCRDQAFMLISTCCFWQLPASTVHMQALLCLCAVPLQLLCLLLVALKRCAIHFPATTLA